MIDKEYKLNFMVEILKSVTAMDEFSYGFGFGSCRFNYFGLDYDAGFDDFLETMDSIVIENVSKVMNQIVKDKANYKKYLNANTERYLLNIYNEVFCMFIVKYKVTYTSESFPTFFPKDAKSFVLKHNTFYIAGDCLDDSYNNALIAADDLSQHVLLQSDDVKLLLANATEWSFANTGQLLEYVHESTDFTEL